MKSIISLCVATAATALLLAVVCEAEWTPTKIDNKVLVPDTSLIDSDTLKEVSADKFLFLWFINVLNEPVYTSKEPWTMFIPKNTGIPKDTNFQKDAVFTQRVLLNHAVVGEAINIKSLPTTPAKTLSGETVKFTDNDGVRVNGVLLTGEEFDLGKGKVYIIEKYIIPTTEESQGAPTPDRHVLKEESRSKPKEERRRNQGFRRHGGGPPRGERKPFGHLPNREVLPGSARGTEFSEFDILAAERAPGSSSSKSFIESLMETLESRKGINNEFVNHYREAGLDGVFAKDQEYTALVPTDEAFYTHYPYDWGFNPFNLNNFTQDVILNHFIPGRVVLEDLPDGEVLSTLGGRLIEVTRNNGRLQVNGEDVIFESGTEISNGRVYGLHKLLFVTRERVQKLRLLHGDLETAPLLGSPWPTSQFLSHLVNRLFEDTTTTYFAEYLNNTNLAYRLPAMDESINPIKYTAVVPVNGAVLNMLYSDAPDPFLFDQELRDSLILNHIIKGRLYEGDLLDGTRLVTLANNSIIVENKEGVVTFNGYPVLEAFYLYNLGNVFLLDGVLGVTDQDVVDALNRAPDDIFGLYPDENTPLSSLPNEERYNTTEENSTFLVDSFTTTTTTSTPTPTTTTSSSPSSSQTTPRVRVETRTEISVSRRINDGLAEPVPVGEEGVAHH
ncbi:uncharacterized protein LOC143041402 [Oratosquilla oratoria]|uniref:uncharacterized protein LOC143041402 n=1 Tax=Oratosquilla oratoria TaxID=337810 RepID=UPI003F75746E